MNIYCGNNLLDSDLINGNSVLGSRLQCFRKGIGKGLNLPYDPKYAEDFLPIQETNFYCGNNDNLPEGYNNFGNLPQCLQKGIGVGKRQKALNGPEQFTLNLYKRYIINFTILLLLFISLYLLKPQIIVEINKNNDKIINWKKFFILYIIIIIPILFLYNFYL